VRLFKKKRKIDSITDVYTTLKNVRTDNEDAIQQDPPSIFVNVNLQGRVILKKTYQMKNSDWDERREMAELVVSDDSGHIMIRSDYREDVWNLKEGNEIIIQGLSASYTPEKKNDEGVPGKKNEVSFLLKDSKVTVLKDETAGRGIYVVGTVRGGMKYDQRPQGSGNYLFPRVSPGQNNFPRGEYRIERKDEVYEISWEDYLNKKGANQNVVIVGGSGYGKTTLVYWLIRTITGYKKVIFAYKNSDEFDRLGYPVLRIRNHSPNVFGDKEAFTQSWMVAFGVKEQNSGITASQIESTVRRIVSGCNNWEEFRSEVEKLQKKTKSLIEKGALADIRNKLNSVFNERMWDFNLRGEICIDFSGLNEEAFKFFSEYLLRSLYREISEGRRERTQIIIDEGHRFLGSQKTMIRELAAMIRSRGSFIISTQQLHSLRGIRGNASMQFSFRLTESDDLMESKALSNEYQWILQRLYHAEFVDLGQYASENDIFIFSLRNLSLKFYDPVEWNPEEYSKEEEKLENEKEGKNMQMNNLELDDSVYSLISGGAKTKYEATKEISEKMGMGIEELKLRVMNSFDRIARQGRISSFRLDGVKVRYNHIYQSPKDEVQVYFRYGTYDGHDYVVEMVRRILEEKGLKPEVQDHRGESSPDIVVRERKLAFEVEMGTKYGHKIDETENRIDGEKKEGFRVIIIVPTEDIKEKYAGMAETYTPRELLEMDLVPV
jgi:ABC-type oligopeptide transport system ATPase subunit